MMIEPFELREANDCALVERTDPASGDLAKLESVIERGLQTYVDVGQALYEIREKRLYRAKGFCNFETYCAQQWGWKSKQVPHNYISAARVAASVQTSGQRPNFSQAVELAGLPKEQLSEAVKLLECRGRAFDGTTVREVRAIVHEIQSRTSARNEAVISGLASAPLSGVGDLWKLGDHRVLVGDSTNQNDVVKLMAGDLADLVFTDPPYNVDYEGYTEAKLKIQGDHMAPEKFDQFLRSAFASYHAVVKRGASLYVCHASSVQRGFQNALEAAGFEVRCQIIWVKNTFGGGFARYRFQHEPLFYCHLAGETDAWYGDRSQSTVWTFNKPAANRLHPTMKPVELIERALVNSSKSGDTVADLFAGSGSTLIACERRGRRARLMEIDPRYADVIIRRWQEYTGKNAVLDGDGRPFDEVSRERLKTAA